MLICDGMHKNCFFTEFHTQTHRIQSFLFFCRCTSLHSFDALLRISLNVASMMLHEIPLSFMLHLFHMVICVVFCWHVFSKFL